MSIENDPKKFGEAVGKALADELDRRGVGRSSATAAAKSSVDLSDLGISSVSIENLKTLEDVAKKQAEIKTELAKQLELIDKIYEGEERANTLKQLAKQNASNELAIQKRKVTLLLEQSRALAAQNKDNSAIVKLLNEEVKKLKEINDQLKQAEVAEENLRKKTQELGKAWEKIKHDTLDFTKNLTNWESRNVTFTRMLDSVKSYDKIAASTAKATGAGNIYTKSIKDTSFKLTELGVSMDETAKIFSDANNTIFAFSARSKSVREDLVITAATFENLGLSSGQFFKSINALNSTLGMTEGKAIKVQESLTGMATGLGMSVSEVNQNLISNLNSLSIYGSEATKKFKDFQTYAKTSNIEIGSLIDLTEKLSTFEGAGELAGRFNAITGQDLFDVSELATLEGTDKIQYIIDKFQEAGLDMDDPKLMRVVKQATGMDAGTFRQLAGLTGEKLKLAKEAVVRGEKIPIEDKAAAAADEQKKAEVTAQMTALMGADKIIGDRFGTGKDALGAYKDLNSTMTNMQKSLGAEGALGLALMNTAWGMKDLIMSLGSNTNAVIANTVATSANAATTGVGAISQAGGFGNLVKTIPGAATVGKIAGKIGGAFKAAPMVPTAAAGAEAAAGAGAAGAEVAAGGGVGILGKIGGIFKSSMNWFKTAPIAKWLGPIASLIEGAFTYQEIAKLASDNPDSPDLRKQIGKKITKFGGNAIINGLGVAFPPLTVVNSLLSLAGLSAGDALAGDISFLPGLPENVLEGIGGYFLKHFGTKPQVENIGTVYRGAVSNLDRPQQAEDAYIPSSNAAPKIMAKGKIYQGIPGDAAMLFHEPTLRAEMARGDGGSNATELIQTMRTLITAIGNAEKEVVIKIDGREIQRAAFKPITQRYAG